jgi:hypothetical protein
MLHEAAKNTHSLCAPVSVEQTGDSPQVTRPHTFWSRAESNFKVWPRS